MISFLRKMRLKLAAENKPKKYLRYAIGEIALVVIGILIALQINTWNESRKLKNEEFVILHSLLDDLYTAKKQSEEFIDDEENAIINLTTVLKNDSVRRAFNNNPSADSIYYRVLWSVAFEVPVINTYEEIKNSGKTGLINNIEIRNRFTSLELSINNLNKLIDDRLTVHQLRIDEIVVNELNFLKILKAHTPSIDIDQGVENDYNKLFEKQKVRNLIGIKTYSTISVLQFREELNSEIIKLIRLIEAELNIIIKDEFIQKKKTKTS